jgi:hypothetical protein
MDSKQQQVQKKTQEQQEQRKRLRAKIAERKGQRTGGGGGGAASAAEQIRADPTSALLRMGIDDASVLQQVSELTKLAPDKLRSTARELASTRADSDDDEAPPCGSCVGSCDTGSGGGSVSQAASTARVGVVSSDEEEEAPPP